MKNLPQSIIITTLMAGTIALPACSGNYSSGKHAKPTMTTQKHSAQTIVGVASSNDSLTTLVAAVKAAGLVETLTSDGPFTVFAPSNMAFNKLPEGTVATLLKPENESKLANLLTYHVVSSEVMAADLVQAIVSNGGTYTIPTVNGSTLSASVVDGSVILTDASGNKSKVTATDIDASNGVVHLIDTVVIPN